MIRIIGIRRLVILVILLAFNGVLASAVYIYLIPEKQNVEQKRRVAQNKVSTLQQDITLMEVEFEQLDKQQGRFDQIKADGFFQNQDRAEAKEMFSLIQKKSRVISAFVSVKPGKLVEDREAEKALHKVLVSEMSVDIKAFDDNDIYHYIDLVQKVFPGVVTLTRMEIRRDKDISSALLRAIAGGASPELVIAEIEFLWRTMIPQDQVLGATGATR
jgi:hypothetical protein